MLVNKFIADSYIELGPFAHKEDAYNLRNAVRRLCMNSHVGHYISHIKIDDALYPFQSLDGINCMPIAICQNLFKVKVKCSNLNLDRYVKKLEIGGPKEVFIHDFADDIVNFYEQNRPICCIHSNKTIEITLYILKAGYKPQEDEIPKEALSTGIKTCLGAEAVRISVVTKQKKYYLDIAFTKCLYPKELMEIVLLKLRSQILNQDNYNLIFHDVTKASDL